MTRNEAINLIHIAKAEVEWNYPMDYQMAFDMAIQALQEPTGDLISRQAAINELEELNANGFYEANEHSKEAYYEIKEMIKNMPSAGKTETVTEFADRCRECGKTKQKWIPVSERLPETNDDVLVYDGIDICVGWYQSNSLLQGWSSHDNRIERATPIIAWMPLPEPYKAQEGEQDAN